MKFGYIDKNHMKAARLMPTPLAPKYLIINGESGAFTFLLNHFLGTGFSISPREIFSQNIEGGMSKSIIFSFWGNKSTWNAHTQRKGEK